MGDFKCNCVVPRFLVTDVHGFCLSEDEHGTFSLGSTLTQYTILRSRLDYFFRCEHISTRATFTFVGILYQILTYVHLSTGIVVDGERRRPYIFYSSGVDRFVLEKLIPDIVALH